MRKKRMLATVGLFGIVMAICVSTSSAAHANGGWGGGAANQGLNWTPTPLTTKQVVCHIIQIPSSIMSPLGVGGAWIARVFFIATLSCG
jgi:hypothetical protein